MSFFSEQYNFVRYPDDSETSHGLRRPQLGAIHAIASYFTKHSQPEQTLPAIVVMPTGSGKTAVLMLAPFVLRAKRVLVITPSDLVRSQVTEQFSDLKILKTIGALATNADQHKVNLVDTKLTTLEAWNELSAFDVVVSTPNCISPGYSDIVPPPKDLFDLLLIDEAHHTPAKTWTAILNAFPSAKKILFTATPFRHDEQTIIGEMIYEFSIREAFNDKIFGELEYVPVELTTTLDADIAIAQKADEVFREDRSHDLDHYLLVRTDTKVHAKELQKIYQQYTKLNLRVLHSQLSPKIIDQVVELLMHKKLDGIICVEMLGEGFDFPNLKIAAIHRPHKSFPVTLQFIGRFARTNAERIGKAKFIALPQDIRIDMEQLYKEGKIWQEIIPALYQNRVLQGSEAREKLATFEPIHDDTLKDLSLDDFKPLEHVKIYRLLSGGHLDVEIRLRETKVIKQFKSNRLSTIVFIAESIETPDWSSTDVFKRIDYDLFVVYYDTRNKLLFINSSRRNETLYEKIANQIAIPNSEVRRYEPLPIWETNRVLKGMQKPCFFNIGMVNRLSANYSESYRIIAGPRAQQALMKADGMIYRRGHVYGRGETEHELTMLGYSSSARVWSNKFVSIPELVDWCKSLAQNIASEGSVLTGSELDNIPTPKRIDKLPKNIWIAEWNEAVYNHAPNVICHSLVNSSAKEEIHPLVDFDLKIVDKNNEKIRISISQDTIDHYRIDWQAVYSPTYPFFQSVSENKWELYIQHSSQRISLVDYLNDHPIRFLTTQQAEITGGGIVECDHDFKPFDLDRLVDYIDWKKEGVNIKDEIGTLGHAQKEENSKNLISIHCFLKEYLKKQEVDVVFYDHASGEIADFITLKITNDALNIILYHVKGAKSKDKSTSKGKDEPKSGARFNDVSEVTAQAVKSMNWLFVERLKGQIKYRHNKKHHPFIKGDLRILENIFTAADQNNLPIISKIVIVQPGLSKAEVAKRTDILDVLASASDYLDRCGGIQLSILGAR